VDDPVANPCLGDFDTVYWMGAPYTSITTDDELYFDSDLTTPVTGYSYVVDDGAYSDGNVYNLQPVTGIVLTDTGYDCLA